MKKYLRHILLLMVMLFLMGSPCKVFAQTINVDGTEVTITFGDEWHVCTRDNPVCCYQVEALGMTEEYMEKFFEENLMYLNAGIIADFDNDGIDFFIIKDKTDFCENLGEFTDEELEDVVQGFADTIDCDVCDVYDENYSFVHMEYVEDEVNYIKYVTVYNSEYYTFIIQKSSPFSKEEKKDVKEIMESVVFGEPVVEKDGISEYIWIAAISAVLIAGAVIVVIVLKKKFKK